MDTLAILIGCGVAGCLLGLPIVRALNIGVAKPQSVSVLHTHRHLPRAKRVASPKPRGAAVRRARPR